ncbi:hypothetical protein AAIH71_001821 [Campylobacter jejuni]
MILLEKVLDERKRQKQEKENDNANNTRSTAQSRLSGAESRESRAESRESGAIISANKEFQNINDEKIPSKLSKEENKELLILH